jgi:hypothetical protein
MKIENGIKTARHKDFGNEGKYSAQAGVLVRLSVMRLRRTPNYWVHRNV